jgi:putative oxidoreductase
MDGFLGRWTGPIYSILRIITGIMFMIHGTQKILGAPAGAQGQPAAGSLPWIAGIIELVCGGLIAIGLLTSIAAFIASGEMAVAYFMAHAPRGFLPITNQGELAVVYCFLFLFIAAYGGGPWSVDALMRRGRTARV